MNNLKTIKTTLLLIENENKILLGEKNEVLRKGLLMDLAENKMLVKQSTKQ